MSREMKFRAWDNKNKKWLCGYEYENLGGFNIIGETILMGQWERVVLPFLFKRNGKKRDDLKIMQYTGLTDKHGQEIYEQDVVEGEGKQWWVLWHAGVAGFELKRIGHSETWMPNFDAVAKDFAVIGNAFEHPELLND